MRHEGVVIWKTVVEIADRICKDYGLSYGKLLPETRKAVKFYGQCYPCDRCHNSPGINIFNCNEKLIYIRIHQINNHSKPLATSTILRTLVHELAHLKEFNHGKAHRAFEKELLAYVKELGYFPKK